MELSPKQQINELIKKNKNILIVGNKVVGGDLVGSMLALERVLSKLDKEVTLVLSNPIDENLVFLPGIEKIQKEIAGTRDLILRIDTNKTPLEKISRNDENEFVNLILTPKKNPITKDNIEFIEGKFKFDLIFVLDTPDVEKIDPIYDLYTELFFETPIINIDHHLGNDYFGTVNMVDLTATSTSEILVSIIESLGLSNGNFDADIATCLLAGIISDTASFKNENTTPKALTISAQMLAAGARQQEIIQNLYKTRPLNTLKLWGKVLSNLQHDKENRITWSQITYKDFSETNSGSEEIWGILDELLMNTPETDLVLLLAECEPNKILARLKGAPSKDVLPIAELFKGSGTPKSAEFELINVSMNQAILKIFTKINDSRNKKLGQQILTNVRDENFVQEKKINLQTEHKEDISVSREQVGTKDKPTDPIAQALRSLSEEIEAEKNKVETQISEVPNIDIRDSKTNKASLSPLGEAMKDHYSNNSYKETKNIDDSEDYDEPEENDIILESKREIVGKGEQAIDVRVWKE
jgi:phosphoesterase RecJ-like protein